MRVWIKNGAQLAWLIDPEERTSYIYRTDGTEQAVEGFDKKLEGEGPSCCRTGLGPITVDHLMV
jgi:Uma2 family endonuclease